MCTTCAYNQSSRRLPSNNLAVRERQCRDAAMQDYDKQLQRALNYDDFDLATELRQRREQLTEAVAAFQVRCAPHWLRVTHA